MTGSGSRRSRPRMTAALNREHRSGSRTSTLATSEAECRSLGFDDAKTAQIAPQKVCPGNKPSTLVLLNALTPESLGALLALYEHKTFVEGVVMGLNSFDQWGVELGKTLGVKVLKDIQGADIAPHDPSTTALIERVKGLDAE